MNVDSDKIETYFKDICYLVRDNLNLALVVLDDIDDEDSDFVAHYMKHHDDVSVDDAKDKITEKATELGELSDKIADEYKKFLKFLSEKSEDELADVEGVDTMKEIWFGDHFGSEKYEALDELIELLKSQKKQLSRKAFTKLVKKM